MGVKIKHTDPTLNSFSTDDIIVNVSEGSLFFKSNTNLFKIKGDTISTTVTESFGNESWFRSGNNLYYTSGSVGIGTTSPDAKLEVAADGTTSQEIAHFGNSNGVGKIKLQIDGAGSSKQVMLDATNNEDIVLSTQGDSYFNISHGNVGVGTTSPGEKLEVVGNISSSGNLFATGLFFRNVTSEKAYIKELNSGGNQIEIGSDNLVVFKETDADQEKVRFDLKNKEPSLTLPIISSVENECKVGSVCLIFTPILINIL